MLMLHHPTCTVECSSVEKQMRTRLPLGAVAELVSSFVACWVLCSVRLLGRYAKTVVLLLKGESQRGCHLSMRASPSNSHYNADLNVRFG